MSNRNATASWSGYSHQGLVGILVALREIRRLIAEGKQNECDIHYLEYENNEDVAIAKRVIGQPVQLLSVHQVKAYYSDGHLFNSYKSVFTGSPIYQREADGKLSKDSHGNKIKTGNFEPGQWCSGLNYLHTVQDIGNWPTTDFSSVGGNPNNIQRFEYLPNVFYCGTDRINEFILYELQKPDFHGENEGLASMALKRLCFELDAKIRFEHANKNSKEDYEIFFSFHELINLIFSNEDVQANDIYICRKLFFDIYMDFRTNSTLDEEHLGHIEELICEIYESFSDNEFLLFVRRLSLNRKPANQTNTHSIFSEDGLRQVFYEVLFEVSTIYPEVNKVDLTVFYKSFGYVLTTIIDDKKYDKEVVKNILNNMQS
ncbi:MAG: ABC-three component system protein, partial [Fluviicola sp.]